MSIIAYRAGIGRKQTPQDPPIATWFEETAGTPTGYVLALDLGQSRDWSAAVVAERIEAERIEYRRYTKYEGTITPYDRRPLIRHNLVHLHRYPLGTSYPDIARSIRNVLVQLPPRRDAVDVVIDATGVGKAVSDQMKELGVPHKAVTITAGTGTSQHSMDHRIAKKALASMLDVVLSEGRIKLASSDPLAQTLLAELQSFTVRVTGAGNETFAALREKDHDDLTIAAAMAVWFGEKRPQPARWVNMNGFFAR
jgi:hypothetical protein